MYPGAGLNGLAHSFSISSLMNVAAAASDKIDLNSYSQMYHQQGQLGSLGGAMQLAW